jgi:hypothetical protein
MGDSPDEPFTIVLMLLGSGLIQCFVDTLNELIAADAALPSTSGFSSRL